MQSWSEFGGHSAAGDIMEERDDIYKYERSDKPVLSFSKNMSRGNRITAVSEILRTTLDEDVSKEVIKASSGSVDMPELKLLPEKKEINNHGVVGVNPFARRDTGDSWFEKNFTGYANVSSSKKKKESIDQFYTMNPMYYIISVITEKLKIYS